MYVLLWKLIIKKYIRCDFFSYIWSAIHLYTCANDKRKRMKNIVNCFVSTCAAAGRKNGIPGCIFIFHNLCFIIYFFPFITELNIVLRGQNFSSWTSSLDWLISFLPFSSKMFFPRPYLLKMPSNQSAKVKLKFMSTS